MKPNPVKPKNRPSRIFMLLLVSAGIILALTACGKAPEQIADTAAGTVTSAVKQAEAAVSSETTAETVAAYHNIAPSTEPLTAADKVLDVEGYGAKGALADDDLSIADMLMYAVQDEYLAHGEYAAIISEFGSLSPYSNIIIAEETHIAALSEIYTAYGLPFPEDASSEHTAIPAGLPEAAQTGVQAEIDNIAMYERFLSYELPDSVRDVFNTLKAASEGHLSAFEKQIDKLS